MNLARAERLRRLRERIETVKAATLASKEHARREAEQAHEHAIRARDELRRVPQGASSAAELHERAAMADRASSHIHRLDEKRTEALSTRDDARAELEDAKRATALAERVRDREAAKLDEKAKREEQALGDEAAVRIARKESS